jgi:hypothetical protein
MWVVTSVSSAGAAVSLGAGGVLEEIGAELELSQRRGGLDCCCVAGACCVYAGDQPSLLAADVSGRLSAGVVLTGVVA